MKTYSINTLIDLLLDHHKEAETKALEKLEITGTMCSMIRELNRLSFNYLVINGLKKPFIWLHHLAVGESIKLMDRVIIVRLNDNAFKLRDLNKERWIKRLREGAVPKQAHTVISKKLQVEVNEEFHKDMQIAVSEYQKVILESKN